MVSDGKAAWRKLLAARWQTIIMGLGTKNRQNQTAEVCKQHLREVNFGKLALVEEFIQEIEGAGNNLDVTRWGEFTGGREKIHKKLDVRFAAWLEPNP
jgi:hypothetical protein